MTDIIRLVDEHGEVIEYESMPINILRESVVKLDEDGCISSYQAQVLWGLVCITEQLHLLIRDLTGR